MSNYSFAQLEGIWQQAGGNPVYAAMAAAIALAESGGNPQSTNSNSNGTTDRGLWQINSIHGSQSTFDPLANAKAAVAISKNGTNWRPWCTAWSNGRCGGTFMGSGSPVLKHLPASSVPASSAAPTPTTITPTSNNTGQVQQTFDPTFGLGGAVKSVTDLPGEVESVYTRVTIALWFGMFVGIGILMMSGGLILLFVKSNAGQTAISVVSGVATKGKAAAVSNDQQQAQPQSKTPQPQQPPARRKAPKKARSYRG